MSDSPATLPARPSLEQLRKQAKDRLADMPDGRLADAQFALARDYGFDSWPKLVHHVEALAWPEVEQQDRIARDMVAVWHRRDEAAAGRLNDLFHSRLDVDRIRRFIEDRLSHLPGGAQRIERVDARDTRLLVARLYGFEDWDDFLAGMQRRGENARGTAGISASPPFYRLDEARRLISPQQPMSARDWDAVIGVIRDRGLTGLDANTMMDDAAMAKLAALAPQLTRLKVHGSDRLTDEGLRHLAAFRDLEDVELGGWHSPMTDAGFGALHGLPRLRDVSAWWSRFLTDSGVKRTLASCPSLENAGFLGTSVGDGLIEALAGKPAAWRVFCGDGVTDAGLTRLHDIPRLQHWRGGDRQYSLLEFEARPTYAAVKGPFTAAGVRSLSGLDGVFALNVHWTAAAGVTSADLGRLGSLANLGFLAIDGDLCDDEAMRQIGTLPVLRMLLAQGPAAGDDGFAALSASPTLEYFWGRECPGLTGRGFAAMASMPSLKGLAVSCKHVTDEALATLPRFPSLRALMPMDVTDDGFRHVGRCERLEELWCMYCRDTGDAATEHVANLQLKTYYAGSTKISDRTLHILSRMTSLERVLLHHCHGVTDAGLRTIARLPNLGELAVEGCRNVTRAGLTDVPARVRVSYSST